ncbi:antibiotic biosynthesis monooxygenase [Paenibacillus swuensis]|uniref:Antibiotic biosynthesis monooxygenase n=1 Tax=Paenibacillus swuensis TaxID=1178515 RepID=A0A172TIU4_9BACL|nr:antibiotic biosynthesis monooxygenase [Paenibacillus swuensis]ANE46930.1 antibiotic biosynthesis monooxygenase [Paenibacillus swuensis]
MLMVTNTIQIRKGHGEAVAERFKNSKGVHLMPGFKRMELLLSKENEEYEELKVCTLWESHDAFEGWVNSDSFKQAHGNRGGGKPSGDAGAEAPKQPPASEEGPVMLGAKLSKHEVLMTREAGEE